MNKPQIDITENQPRDIDLPGAEIAELYDLTPEEYEVGKLPADLRRHPRDQLPPSLRRLALQGVIRADEDTATELTVEHTVSKDSAGES